MSFVKVNCGAPGSLHDRTVLNYSPLPEMMVRSAPREERSLFLVADSAYPLCDWIMTPWGNVKNKTAQQMSVDKIISRTRNVVEHAFGELKSRWRFLNKYLKGVHEEKVKLIVIACCVLHNLCKKYNDQTVLEIEQIDGDDDDNIECNVVPKEVEENDPLYPHEFMFEKRMLLTNMML